jgi:hypothetical protein
VLVGVGIPILHVQWQRRYDSTVLATQLHATIGLSELTPATSAAPATLHAPQVLAPAPSLAARSGEVRLHLVPALAPAHSVPPVLPSRAEQPAVSRTCIMPVGVQTVV